MTISRHFKIMPWLGMRDSNPRMSAPKADALPLGESPVMHLEIVH